MTLGHVFVLRADLLNLKTDAWMLSTDRLVEIKPWWTVNDPELQLRAQAAAPAAFRRGDALAFAVAGRRR